MSNCGILTWCDSEEQVLWLFVKSFIGLKVMDKTTGIVGHLSRTHARFAEIVMGLKTKAWP